jgi:phage portal protein BeeE
LAIQKGEAESLAADESLSRVYMANNLAFGYVSSEGVKQIAALTGVSVAVETTEETDGRSFIAEILPQILQNTTREIVWTASKT